MNTSNQCTSSHFHDLLGAFIFLAIGAARLLYRIGKGRQPYQPYSGVVGEGEREREREREKYLKTSNKVE